MISSASLTQDAAESFGRETAGASVAAPDLKWPPWWQFGFFFCLSVFLFAFFCLFSQEEKNYFEGL